MFERLQERAGQAAAREAERRRVRLAERLSAELPEDVSVGTDEAGVRLSGRGLKRRFALDRALRGLIGRIA